MPSRLNPKQQERHLAAFTSDREWNYLALPLKWVRNDGQLICGILLDPVKADQKLTIHEGTVFHGANPGGRTWDYPNPQAAIDAGWEVD